MDAGILELPGTGLYQGFAPSRSATFNLSIPMPLDSGTSFFTLYLLHSDRGCCQRQFYSDGVQHGQHFSDLAGLLALFKIDNEARTCAGT